jgi:hypothetical protein
MLIPHQLFAMQKLGEVSGDVHRVHAFPSGDVNTTLANVWAVVWLMMRVK